MKKLIEVQLSAFKKHYLIIYYTLRRVSVIYPAEISGALKGIEHYCSLDEAYQILVNNMRKNYNIKPENIKEIQNAYLEQLVINDLMQNKNNKNQKNLQSIDKHKKTISILEKEIKVNLEELQDLQAISS